MSTQVPGMKFDTGKIRFSLLTRGLATPLKRVAEVMEYGARKYLPNSWQQVSEAKTRYEDALDRHLNQWKAGELIDPESHLHHLAHIATNALFLLYFYESEINDQYNNVSPPLRQETQPVPVCNEREAGRSSC